MVPNPVQLAELAIEKQAQTTDACLDLGVSSTTFPMGFGQKSASSSTKTQPMLCSRRSWS